MTKTKAGKAPCCGKRVIVRNVQIKDIIPVSQASYLQIRIAAQKQGHSRYCHACKDSFIVIAEEA